MELYDLFINIIDTNLIYCLIPMILILILIEALFKNKFSTKKVLNVICWVIISYTVVSLIHFIIEVIFSTNKLYTNIDRTTGSYQIAYWIVFLLAAVLPFTLFIKKMATKFWYVLIVAFFIKAGGFFEQYVIIVTSIHRDYIMGNGNSTIINFWVYGLSLRFLQSLILVILTLGILKLIEQNKTVHDLLDN